MKIGTLRKFVVLPLLMLCLVGGQAGAQAFVWCIGEHGRAVLEYAKGDSCSADSDRAVEADLCETVLESPAGNDHCGPCIDIPTVTEINSGRFSKSDDSAASADLPAIASAPVCPPFTEILITCLYPQPPPRISQSILFHRTVVLLN